MDSGAADTVANEGLTPWIPVKETEASKAGLQYNAANNGIIKNLGEKDLDVLNDNFIPGGITVQICDKVNKFLAAVSQIGKAGNKITFFDDDGKHRIVNKTTWEETPMFEENGTFHMNLWVWNPEGKPAESEQGFRGQCKF